MAARTRSGAGDKADDAISISSGSPSPSPRRSMRLRPVISSRVDGVSGRIKKLSPPRPPGQIPACRQPTAPKLVFQPAAKTAPESSQAIPTGTRTAQKNQRIPSPQRGLIQSNKIIRHRSGQRSATNKGPRIPLGLEKKLYRTIQTLVEHSLFHWTGKWVDIVLKESGWLVPEQAELNWWVRAMARFPSQVDRALVDSKAWISRTQFKSLIESLHDIRHAAVHRHSIPLADSMIKLGNAVDLISRLGDEARAKKLSSIETALNKFDMGKLEEILDKPLKEFDKKWVSSAEVGIVQGGGEQAPITGAHQQDIASGKLGINAPGQRQIGNDRKTLSKSAQKAFIGLEIPAGEEFPENKDGLLNVHSKWALPSVEREFVDHRERLQQAISKVKGSGQTGISNQLLSYTLIDLTEDREEGPSFVKHRAEAKERTTSEVGPHIANKRSFATFQQKYIEILDDDQVYPNGEDEDPDEEEEPVIFSHPTRPRLGVDY